MDTEKLRVEMDEVDGNAVMQTLLPYLQSDKWQELAGALLLATGRRTVEILKTGDFSLGENMDTDSPAAVFSGQAKSLKTESYVIPLLTNYWLVADAFKRLRSKIDCSKMSESTVNSNFRDAIALFLKKKVNLKPHELRSVYAMISYKLIPGKKMSLIGFISKALGHSSPANAIYYSRIKVTDVDGIFEVEPKEFEMPTDWTANNLPEEKVVKNILEMMERRVPITASAIRTEYGSSVPLNTRVIKANQDLINQYQN